MRTRLALATLASAATLGIPGAPGALAQPTVPAVYVTNNVGSPGSIAAFGNDQGTLTLLGNAFAGFNPQGVALTPDGRYAIVINGTSSVTTEEVYALPLNADGSIGFPAAPSFYPDGNLSLEITRDGWIIIPATLIDGATSSRVNAMGRVEEVDRVVAGTFPTCAESTPDGKFVYIAGSGVNNLYTFSINRNTGKLTAVGGPTGSTTIFALVAHPTLPVLYASTGLQNTIQKYDIANDGTPVFDQGFPSGGTSAVEMAVHPEGTYLYVCHVVSDTLAVLPVNPDGSLAPAIQSIPIGNDIRDVETDGVFVYVTDESSIGSSPVGVLVYKIASDGTLTSMGPAVDTNGGRPQYIAVWTPPSIECEGDTDGNGVVNFLDLNAVLTDFGATGENLPGDVDGNGTVNFADLNTVLSNFGITCA